MRSPAVAAIFGGALAGIIALVAFATDDERERAFRLPVSDSQPAATLRPGQTVCQRPLAAQGDFKAVQLTVGSAGRARFALAANPLRGGGDQPLAVAELAFSSGPSIQRAEFDRTVHKEERFALCVTNSGERVAAIYGAEPRIDDGSEVVGKGAREAWDLALIFLRDKPRSVLVDVPDMFERAALFKPAFVGAWTFWLLLAAVALGVPALLSAALRSSVEPDA